MSVQQVLSLIPIIIIQDGKFIYKNLKQLFNVLFVWEDRTISSSTLKEYTVSKGQFAVETTDSNLINELKGKRIVEVTNEIDNSTYLKDGSTETNLLQSYSMPTVEIVYIILD